MKIKQNENLKSYNTFNLAATAQNFISIFNENDIYSVLVEDLKPLKIIGGGSNILITKDIEAYVLKNEIKGIDIIDEDDESIMVEVGAGEQWHNFVMWCISHRLGGLENLSLIPGSVGAAPMQNIGAYGVEQESCFHSLTAIHLESGIRSTFFKHQCKFGYRESIFKNEVKDQYIITKVKYILNKINHKLNLDYGAIKEMLALNHIVTPTIKDVSDVVIKIRQSKLPDPQIIGNAGSFFKNPVIALSHYNELKTTYDKIPCFLVNDNSVKVPAGWLIENIGYKGFVRGQVGVHKDQALVLVNHGNGQGREIYALALEIIDKVRETYNIELTAEVNIW
jgi:UDP-N-acetylmuramate dehydrogenase